MITKGYNQMTDTTDAQKYIDAKAFDTAAYSMERFAAAVHSVSDALEKMEDHSHGGVSFKVVGSVMILTVNPPVT